MLCSGHVVLRFVRALSLRLFNYDLIKPKFQPFVHGNYERV